jgi:hypothetical protein
MAPRRIAHPEFALFPRVVLIGCSCTITGRVKISVVLNEIGTDKNIGKCPLIRERGDRFQYRAHSPKGFFDLSRRLRFWLPPFASSNIQGSFSLVLSPADPAEALNCCCPTAVMRYARFTVTSSDLVRFSRLQSRT